MLRRSRLVVSAVLFATIAFALVACDPSTSTTSPSSETTATPPPGSPATSPLPKVDPNVPYSPSPSDLVPRINGYVPETLTIPTADDSKMLVTVTSTAIDLEWVNGYRATSVWVTLENPGDGPWSGVPADFAQINDEAGNVFKPVDPTPGELHPDPQRYGASNRDLTRRYTIDPGDSLRGVIVFHPTGGNRPIAIVISMDGGSVWGEWATSLGPY